MVSAALVCLAAGCSSFVFGGGSGEEVQRQPDAAGDRAGSQEDHRQSPAGRACGRDNTWGSFEVHIDSTGGGASGKYVDGPQPVLPQQQSQDGPCVFYAFDSPPLCDPPCIQGSLCGLGNLCHEFPSGLDAGLVTISGTAPPLTMEPTGSFAYYTTEEFPGLFGPGDEVRLSAAGGSGVGPFELSASGVSVLSLDSLDFTMVEGEPFVVAWEPAGDPPEALMRLRLEIDHHAFLAAYMECEVPDKAGQIVVPDTMVQAAIEVGHLGAGIFVENASLERFTFDEVETSFECARLVVRSQQKIYVETVLR